MIVKIADSALKLDELLSILREFKIKHRLTEKKIVVQVVKPAVVVSERQLYQAYNNAKDSFIQGLNRAIDLSNEFVLWLANDDNFDTAVKKVGISSTKQFCLIIIAKDAVEEGRIRDKLIDELKLKLKEASGLSITNKEDVIKEKLALERLAMHKLSRLRIRKDV